MKNSNTSSMGHDDQEEPRKVSFPLDINQYMVKDEIGRGASTVVYKAICIPMKNSEVAIKTIDLDKSRVDFDELSDELATIVSLHSHPNILNPHCFFTLYGSLWVVMPLMSAGSLQSIIESSKICGHGLSETCIAIVLKETLCGLSYLHDLGFVHKDVKLGNILVDWCTGAVKLSDFGVSSSIYKPNSSSSSSLPYWVAPEVIHNDSHRATGGYSSKSDIWSFGVIALELAHGRPPLSSSHHDGEKGSNNSDKKVFSKEFKDMVGLCLDRDPSKRPSADELLNHSFFKNCKVGPNYLVNNVLKELPSLEDRFNKTKIKTQSSLMNINDVDKDEENKEVKETSVIIRGWKFNKEMFELEGFDLYEVGDEAPVNGNNESAESDKVRRQLMLKTIKEMHESIEVRKQQLKDMYSIVSGGKGELKQLSRKELMMELLEDLKTEVNNEMKKNAALEEELASLLLNRVIMN